MRTLQRMLFMSIFLAPPALAADLDEILAGNSRAVGGADNWARITNLRIQLDIAEPGFEVSGTYLATREGEMRIDIFAGGERVFAEGLHQGQAWEWRPQAGRIEADQQAAAALRHGIEMPGRFYTLEQARSRGTKIELVSSAETGQSGQWQLRVTLEDGFGSDFFIDQASHRVVRKRDHRAFHPGIDPTETLIETRYQGELWVDGVLHRPRSDNRDINSDEWLGTTTVRSVEHNVDIPDRHFEGVF